jgi:transposase
MGCADKKLSEYLTHAFMAHCDTMICSQVTLSGEAEWPKVADAVIEAHHLTLGALVTTSTASCPTCAQPARRLHSRYRRTLADLPWATLPVRLVRADDDRCGHRACARYAG